MRIATWNVERLKHINCMGKIQDLCLAAKADIFVLTETDERLSLDYDYSCKTLPAKQVIGKLYAETENRVTIFSKYPIVKQHESYDPYTALCAEVETDRGNLIVYGTIM